MPELLLHSRGPGRARSRWRARLAAAALLSALSAAAVAAMPANLRVIHPISESGDDARPGYPVAVLRLALERSGQPHRLQPAALRMPQSRSLRLLEAGTELDVAWTVTTREREARLRPVRFPIDRGLIGWRLLLVRRDDAAKFADITTPAGFAGLQGGQGHDWPDLGILRANGLDVVGAPSYEGLFRMLARGHIDHFPRSVTEAGPELAARPGLGLVVAPGLVLHYPSALYFFVHPGNDALAEALATGLERAHADGSLAALFEAYHGAGIAAAGLGDRRVIALANPELPPETPLARADLWFTPGRD